MRSHSMTTDAPRKLVLMVAVLVCSAPAHAQDYARPGLYLGAGVLGGAYTRFDDELEDRLRALGYVASIDTDPTVGFELYGGYRLHPNFAVEGEFEMLPEADVEVDGFEAFELQSWTLTANGKLFALAGRAQPFLLVGLGLMEAELEDTVGLGLREDESDFVMRYGVGLDLYLSETVALSAGVDYLLPTGDLEDLDYVSFGGGLLLRF